MSSLTAKNAHRDKFAAILSQASEGLLGCRSHVVALDTSRDDMIWVTEVWESKDLHEASLKKPKVMDAIAKGRPLMTNFGVVETVLVSAVRSPV
jgi:quinol monooxygenase YgiN